MKELRGMMDVNACARLLVPSGRVRVADRVADRAANDLCYSARWPSFVPKEAQGTELPRHGRRTRWPDELLQRPFDRESMFGQFTAGDRCAGTIA